MIDIIIIWILFIFGVIMMIRNKWVLNQRLSIDYTLYDKLPSYNEMMFKFWIWDINKFIK